MKNVVKVYNLFVMKWERSFLITISNDFDMLYKVTFLNFKYLFSRRNFQKIWIFLGFCVQKDGQGFELLTKAFANHAVDRAFKVTIQKGLVITIISVHAIAIE